MRTIDQIQGAAADHFGNGDVNQAMGEVTDLIHAVIADEATKAKPVIREVVSPPFAFEDDEQPVAAAGDVPEWCIAVARENLQAAGIGGHTRDFILDKQAARIHAAADRDKWIERAGEHAKTIGEQAKQLATSQAEVERLTRERDNWEEAARQHLRNEEFYRDIVHRIGHLFGVDARTSDDGSVQDSVLALKVPELVTKLREEVSRLSRPVDKDSIHARWADIGKFISTVNEFASAVAPLLKAPLLKAERNAREAAEAERDELREAWKFCYAVQSSTSIAGKVGRWFASIRGERGGPINGLFDDPNDAVLAAFRAERAVRP